jgi:tetratricopeptide (TPR) repeat protein
MLVVWIHASDPSRFKQGYNSIAEKLRLPGWGNPKVDVLQLVHDWLLDRQNGQWLMILDNVDDEKIFFGDNIHGKPLESYLPQTAHGTILITSRNKSAAATLVGGHNGIIEVEPMGEDDALALLRNKVRFVESDQTDAKALVHALECIPLAITHAAAYIQTRVGITTIGSYLKLFHDSEANQTHLLSKDELKDIRRDPSIRYAVIATWQISFEHIRKTERLAAELLALMSMFDKQGIPRRLVQGETSELEFGDALAPLLNFSFVKIENNQQAVTMHRLVQLSMRRWLKKEKEIGKWVKEATQVMDAVFPSGEYGTWEECRILIPHFKEVTSHATDDNEVLVVRAKTTGRAAWYLLEMGQYVIAEGMFRSSLEVLENSLGSKDLGTISIVSGLGSALGRQAKHEETEIMHRRALQAHEEVLGREHPYTLTSANNLGVLFYRLGRFAEAETMYRHVIKGREEIFGYEHEDVLRAVLYLGSLLMQQTKYEEAEAMMRRALQGYEKILGREHRDTIRSVLYLGRLLKRQKRYEEAEVMTRRALQGYEKIFSHEHPYTLVSLYDLARIFHIQHRYSDSLDLYQEAHNGLVKALGEEHPDTVACSKYLELARKQVDISDY